MAFRSETFDKMENKDDCLNKIMLNDDDTFHLSGKV